MPSDLNQLQRRQLDELLDRWRLADLRQRPPAGWLRAVREGLGMSAAQLARRLGLSRQAMAEMERREAQGGITLAALARAAAALDADLVYAVVPRRPLDSQRRDQALQVVRQEVERAAHSMRLEDQAVRADDREQLMADRADALLRERRGRLWDDDLDAPTR
jgi:predicted DNA-binding mobile mystery protein A